MNPFKNMGAKAMKSNKFDLSHERKQSMKMGKLYPAFQPIEVLPGDNFQLNTEIMIRFAPMLAPVMSRIEAHIHYFFVPNRIVYDDWEEFITGGRLGTSTPAFPTITINNNNKALFQKKSLGDYMGIPPTDAAIPIAMQTNTPISALPFRGYLEIYNEYYRDQNLEEEIAFDKTSGEQPGLQVIELTTMRTRAWEKDYFTTCLPFAQRGAAVELPIGDSAPVVYADDAGKTATGTFRDTVTGNASTTGNLDLVSGKIRESGVPGSLKYFDPENSLEADLSSATATTINDLRKANAVQTWFERAARVGSRYVEQLRGMFNVKSSDARLQRPEFLGGSQVPVVISEVLNSTTSDAAGSLPVGDMAGHGIGVSGRNGFGSKFFEEHGYLFGIISVKPKTAYSQGIHKSWMRFEREEFYWPDFAHLGEQNVRWTELYHDWTEANDDQLVNTFGYQSRYAEYKFINSSTHGDFRDQLAYWHTDRIFNSRPQLNANFVQADPTKRIFAVTDPNEDELYVQMFHRISCLRRMPYHGIPDL